MPESKKHKVEDINNRLFQLCGSSDGTVTVLLEPKFNGVPKQMLATIVWQIEQQHAINTFVRRAGEPHSVSYGIWTSQWVPRSTSRETIQSSPYSIVGLANLVALDQFCAKNLSGQDATDVKWVNSIPCITISNPHKQNLPSLPANAVGWSFDSNGCIALYVMRIVDGGCVCKWPAYVRRAVHVTQHMQRLERVASSTGTVGEVSATEE